MVRKGLEVATNDAKMIRQGLGDAKDVKMIRRGLQGDEDGKKMINANEDDKSEM